MVEGKWFAQGADLTQPLAIRQAVLGMSRDALDDEAQQVVAYREGEPVGTARLWWRDGSFWLGDLCVLTQARGQGYGDLLMRLTLYKAMTHQARSVRLLCPAALTPFFARYGFHAQTEDDPSEMLLLAQDLCLSCHG